MCGKGMRFLGLMVMLLLCNQQGVLAKTWQLDKGETWKEVSTGSEDKFMPAAAQIKQLIDSGQTKQAKRAIIGFKKEFPETAGSDFGAFMEAELLFSKGKLVKATRGYDKLLTKFPESRLFEAVLDRQFSIGMAFLGGKKRRILGIFNIRGYSEGVRIMERISERADNLPIAIKAETAIAKSFEKRRKFEEAYEKWSEISSRWPTGNVGKESLLGMARCKYMAYKGPKYDVSDMVSAKSYYENFKLRYPGEAEDIGVEGILKEINEQLAYKKFNIGRYYQDSGNKLSANLYYQLVIDDWPGSTAAKMAKEKMTGKNETK